MSKTNTNNTQPLPTDAERAAGFKRRLAAALKRILTATIDKNGEEQDDEKSNHIS